MAAAEFSEKSGSSVAKALGAQNIKIIKNIKNNL